jgi:hypothetical protein
MKWRPYGAPVHYTFAQSIGWRCAFDFEALPTDLGQQSVVGIRGRVTTGLEDTG